MGCRSDDLRRRRHPPARDVEILDIQIPFDRPNDVPGRQRSDDQLGRFLACVSVILDSVGNEFVVDGDVCEKGRAILVIPVSPRRDLSVNARPQVAGPDGPLDCASGTARDAALVRVLPRAGCPNESVATEVDGKDVPIHGCVTVKGRN